MTRRWGRHRPRRLRCIDYTSCGEYFITTVTRDRALLFGSVVGDVVRLSPAGEAVRDAWLSLPGRFPFVRLDDSVVMPNHFHGVLVFLPEDELDEGARRAMRRCHLNMVVQAFKSTSAVEVNRVLGRKGRPVWQAGFYEHTVRDERGFEAIRAYIARNPEAWSSDEYFR
jgi:REP element-mobilizing transposase RayT